ncbi:hypothetical protein [Streptomyces sp. NPDC056296]
MPLILPPKGRGLGPSIPSGDTVTVHNPVRVIADGTGNVLRALFTGS